MQIVSNRDYLHELPNPVFRKNNKSIIIFFLSAELGQRVVKVKTAVHAYGAHVKLFFSYQTPNRFKCCVNFNMNGLNGKER